MTASSDADRRATSIRPVAPACGAEVTGVDLCHPTADESRPLLQYLFDHATRAEFTCRVHWTPGTLAIWDNRCLLHLAINDYDGSRRLLHRTTVAGERPVGIAG